MSGLSLLTGGKTGPRLVEDLNLYDPINLTPSRYNVLTEGPLIFDETKPTSIRKISKYACRHVWAIKKNQVWRAVQGQTRFTAGAFCGSCRCHLKLDLNFDKTYETGHHSCPQPDAPLHHFVYRPRSSPGLHRPPADDAWTDEQLFRCSKCEVELGITVSAPRLKPDWVRLLTDRNLTTARAEEAIKQEPELLEGIAIPPPIQVLSNLRAYISNALRGLNERKRISPRNKKFLLCFGPPCEALLTYLGFTHLGAGPEEGWMPPDADSAAPTPFEGELNLLLDDVEHELIVLLSKQPEEERRREKVYTETQAAKPWFLSMLNAKDYQRSAASRTVDLTDEEEEEHPFYAGLGTVGDFHDNLLMFAYEQQKKVDDENAPYYLECLQGIAHGRHSEELQTKVAIEASSGHFSTADIRNAYQSFNLSIHDPNLSDTHIIGLYTSRLQDSPKQEGMLRNALALIGRNRNSDRLREVAAEEITTYHHALKYLEATEDMANDLIYQMYLVKMNEEDINETKRENANKSLRIIAEQRNSPSLLESLESGNFSETEMDFSQAYALLGISDMTIDDDLVLSSYTSSIHEVPAQSGNYKRALAAIAKSRKSALLAAEAGVNIGSPDQHSLAEWPVGLENIGNTCYLNSLLQFYFTITPLRELVLNFDKYKMDVENADLSKKQVGSRKVLKREIVRAQAFVKELQGLFESMINAPKRCVKPRLELGQLVFFSSRDEEVRRQSILSGKRPNLKDITGSASGSLPASSPVEANQQEHLPPYSPSHLPTVEEATESEESRRISASSDGTLVEAPVPDTPGDDFMIIDSIEKQQTQIFEDKENLAPVPEMLERPATPEPALKPLEESSPSRINEQRAQSPTKELLHDSDYTMSPQQTYNSLPPPPAQPARPPPIPPRQKPEENNHMKKAEVEMGAQQDVGEVLGNVLFQLQCAIKPESIDSSGEQIDTVKNLFFGKQKNHITNKKGEKRTKEEFFSDIKIDVASGARDIYDALDATFDMQEVEVEGGLEPQYTTISSLPPVMQILIQRVQFDAVKKTTYKSNNHLGLQETIYMDRYMEDGVPDLDQRRQERWAWRKELVALIEQRDLLKKSQAGLEMPDVLRCAADFLQQCSEFDSNTLNIQPEIIEFLERAAEHTRTQLSDLESQIQTLQTKISTQFADLRSLPYRLHSVFIHRGESNSGHYWIYIYDFSRGIWRKYNDETVTQVSDPKKEIFEEDPGLVLKNRPATPYFLVYLKDEAKDKLQAPVLREITEEGEDTVMDVDGDGEVGADANYSSVSNWVSEQQAQKAFVPVNPFGGVGGPSRTTIGENDDEGPVNTDW